MRIKTKDLQLAIKQVQEDTQSTAYMEISMERGSLSVSAVDGSACEHKVTIYDADSNIIPKLTTERKLGGVK